MSIQTDNWCSNCLSCIWLSKRNMLIMIRTKDFTTYTFKVTNISFLEKNWRYFLPSSNQLNVFFVFSASSLQLSRTSVFFLNSTIVTFFRLLWVFHGLTLYFLFGLLHAASEDFGLAPVIMLSDSVGVGLSPCAIVWEVCVNGELCWAARETSSVGDFTSSSSFVSFLIFQMFFNWSLVLYLVTQRNFSCV